MSTKIEWTDETWNPVVGCQKVSEGCQNCYAEKMARRLANMPKATTKYAGVVHQMDNRGWTGAIQIDEQALTAPLRWKKPRMIFVVSMGDLFYEGVPFEFIYRVFAVMALCPQHTFQMLTKRPERMAECMKLMDAAVPGGETDFILWDAWRAQYGSHDHEQPEFPLPNVWLGTTAENQEQADKRIPALLQTPAAKRFVSIEPMLGPVNIGPAVDPTGHCCGCDAEMCRNCGYCRSWVNYDEHGITRLDWVIAGGESGPGARPMQADWARSVRDQCQAAGVPFLFKQWGGVNKKKAGRLLDGRTWDEFPDDQRKATS